MQSLTDPNQLAQVISHAMGPAFLLSAVAGFVAIPIGRMTGIIDRIRQRRQRPVQVGCITPAIIHPPR